MRNVPGDTSQAHNPSCCWCPPGAACTGLLEPRGCSPGLGAGWVSTCHLLSSLLSCCSAGGKCPIWKFGSVQTPLPTEAVVKLCLEKCLPCKRPNECAFWSFPIRSRVLDRANRLFSIILERSFRRDFGQPVLQLPLQFARFQQAAGETCQHHFLTRMPDIRLPSLNFISWFRKWKRHPFSHWKDQFLP